MRVGIFLAYWPWFSPEEHVDLAVMADERGMDSVWIAEGYGQDVVSVLGLLAGRTERVALGSGLMQIPARQPAAAAMAAMTLDVLSGGRFRLGLGVSGPQVSEGWYGVPFNRPARRTREYVEIIRKVLAREEPLEYDGREWTLPLTEAEGGSGLGKPLKLLAKPVQDPIPIYLGAIGPKSIEQTGEIADGWFPFLLDPDKPEHLMDPLRAGLDKAGRSLNDIDICAAVPVCVADDVQEARDQVRPWLAFYLGAMGAPDKNFYVEVAELYGHGDSARDCQKRWLSGDQSGAAQAITPELIDSTCIATTPAGLDDRLAAYEAAGADAVIGVPAGDKAATVRALADAAGS